MSHHSSSRLLTAILLLAVLAGCSSSEKTVATVVPDRAVVTETPPALTEDDTPTEVTTPTIPLPLPAPVTAQLDTVQAGRFDQGKMWTFDTPPADYFTETYGFAPDDEWFDEARLAALRIPGCSASFVSPSGLMLTNHHCGRSYLSEVSQDGETLLDDGFYASTLADERRVESLYADQLIDLADVTDEVTAALEAAQTDAERAQALQDITATLEARFLEAATEAAAETAPGATFEVEIISLYNGGRYSAYTFRRYTDVRLVLSPELAIGYYGGDPDNFTFPRYNLDMMLFRVYDDDGAPLSTPHYFQWADFGVRPGDATFVIGNPGSTFRLETVSQLDLRQGLTEEAVLSFYRSRIAALEQAFEATGDESLRNTIFSLSNGEKLYSGRLRAVNDPVLRARRVRAEENLRAELEADSVLAATYGPLFDQMAEVQTQRATFGNAYRSFLAFQPGGTFTAPTLGRAALALQYLNAVEGEAPAEQVDQLRTALLEYPTALPGADRFLLEARMQDIARAYGPDSELGQAALQGRTPEAAAAFLLEQSMLADPERLAEALAPAAEATDASAPMPTLALTREDPAIQVVAALLPELQAFQSAWGGLSAQERDLARRLGRARFEVYGTDVPPDATFSLRIADGVVEGYAYNGTVSPPYTTFFGLYERFHAHGGEAPWALPERWLEPPASFNLATPVNFVATADITGGNSGSPVVNRNLELVGLAFDGNIESLEGDFIYRPSVGARSVMVDVRGMREALDHIYDADRLVLELATGTLVESETEADAVRAGAGD
ncbi:MAG: S46 family peptidase [Bacteroidota bacterium]